MGIACTKAVTVQCGYRQTGTPGFIIAPKTHNYLGINPMLCRLVILCLLVLCFGRANATEPVTIGQRNSIHSGILNENREYQVYLPESYGWAADRRYPVLYVLDGRAHFSHTAGSVGYLAAHGEIPEMIVVAISSTVRIRDFTQTDWPAMWVGGGGAANFRRFLSEELIPTINKTYRTDGFQALSGHSAGGQFVLYCLTAQPSLFQAYFALSPDLSWDSNLPQRSLEKSFAEVRTLRSFLYFAYSDDLGRALADDKRLVATLRKRAPQGFRWVSQAFAHETHGSVPLLSQIDALRRLYTGYRFHNDSIDKGFAFAEQHFEKVSKTLGWRLAVPENVINAFGYAALSKGRMQEAITLFKRNVEANPNSANAYDSLAEAFVKTGQLAEAARVSGIAVELATKFGSPNLVSFVENDARIKAQFKALSAGK